jgi:hypothetical protein
MSPFWRGLKLVEQNALWRCNYCGLEKTSSYTRVEAHLLQITGRGISKCPKVTYEMLSDMRSEVERCKDLVERSKTRIVSLHVPPSSSNSNKKKRGPVSQLEKSWALQDCKHLDAKSNVF